jgi:uncharacterized protein (TIGR03382 family)
VIGAGECPAPKAPQSLFCATVEPSCDEPPVDPGLHEMGGCSTGHSTGGVAALALLWLCRRRRSGAG